MIARLKALADACGGSRRAATLAGGSLWLLWSTFLPDSIPLYGLHVRNVRLERESAAVRGHVFRLERERAVYRRILASVKGDPLYWEAAARRAGMRKDGETLVGLTKED